MIRPQLQAAFDACDNRDHLCSCLECVLTRQKNRPVVVFEPEDIEWNKKIDATRSVFDRRGVSVAVGLFCMWGWFCVLYQTCQCVVWAWGKVVG